MSTTEQFQLWGIIGVMVAIYLYGEWFWHTGRGHARKAHIRTKKRAKR